MAFSDLLPVLPELLIASGILLLVLLGAWLREKALDLVNGYALLLIVLSFGLLWFMATEGSVTWAGLETDALARFGKSLLLIGAFCALVLAIDPMKSANVLGFEYAILILFALLGMMLMLSAHSLLMLYLAMELQSLALYVLAGYHRRSLLASEAALKYFVLGALATGLFLFGASFLYGASGSLMFADIAEAIGREGQNGTSTNFQFVIGVVFILSALAFKVSAVPFHMWTPDVYQGAPTPVTLFFASAPKVAAMLVLLRLTSETFAGGEAIWRQVIIFMALASMAWGAFAAIGQSSLKRLLAYSSIGHMGYALVGLVAGSEAGREGVLIYMTIYMVMTVGAFAFILALQRDGTECEKIDDLAGLSRQHPVMAFAFSMLLLSLAGIPPLAGFFGKYMVFKAAVDQGFVTLAVIGVLTTVVAAYYYLRVIKVMYFDEGDVVIQKPVKELRFVLLFVTVFVLLFWFLPGEWLAGYIGYIIPEMP